MIWENFPQQNCLPVLPAGGLARLPAFRVLLALRLASHLHLVPPANPHGLALLVVLAGHLLSPRTAKVDAAVQGLHHETVVAGEVGKLKDTRGKFRNVA